MSGKQTIDNLKSFCGFPTNVIKKKCENIDQFFFMIGFVITHSKSYHYIIFDLVQNCEFLNKLNISTIKI